VACVSRSEDLFYVCAAVEGRWRRDQLHDCVVASKAQFQSHCKARLVLVGWDQSSIETDVVASALFFLGICWYSLINTLANHCP